MIQLSKKNIAELSIAQASNDLLIHATLMNPAYDVNWHHRVLAQYLQRVESGEIKRLMVFMPPRHSKSHTTTEIFSNWFLGRNPEKFIMATSYSGDLASSFSRKSRNMMATEDYQMIFPNVSLSKDSKSAEVFHTNKGGGMISGGVKGALTGKGFHVGIIDDPVKDREEAESPLIREKVWDWYKSVFYTRRQDGDSAIILIMTRWHEDDLAGRLLAVEKEVLDAREKGIFLAGDVWEKVVFPALAIEKEEYREIGEPLWSNKFDKESLIQTQGILGSRDFEALYQQDPLSEGSGAFTKESFIYFSEDELIKGNYQTVSFVDPAISERQGSDQSVVITISRNIVTQDIFIRKCWNKVGATPDEIIIELFNQVFYYKCEKAGVEINQYQKALAIMIKKEMRLRDKAFILDEITSTTNKEARIKTMLQPKYSNKWIWHNRKDCQELEKELLKFPNAKHDDNPDALAGAVGLLDETAPQSEPSSVYTGHSNNDIYD